MERKEYDEKIIRIVIEKHYKDFGVYRFLAKYKLPLRVLFYIFVAFVTVDFIFDRVKFPAAAYLSYFIPMFILVVIGAIDHMRIGRMLYKIYHELNSEAGIPITYKNVCELVDKYLKSK